MYVINVGDYGCPHIGLNINEIFLVGGQVTCLDDYRHRNILVVQPLMEIIRHRLPALLLSPCMISPHERRIVLD